jgi:hypothetical protein
MKFQSLRSQFQSFWAVDQKIQIIIYRNDRQTINSLEWYYSSFFTLTSGEINMKMSL